MLVVAALILFGASVGYAVEGWYEARCDHPRHGRRGWSQQAYDVNEACRTLAEHARLFPKHRPWAAVLMHGDDNSAHGVRAHCPSDPKPTPADN
jgi:hypothetical protein